MAQSVTQDRGPEIVAVSGTFLALVTVAVALRFCSRYVGNKAGLWWDDWLSLAALPFIWAICALSIYWVSIGLGKHVEQVHTPQTKLFVVLFVVELLYNTGLTLIKMSVLLFYVRVFKIQVYQIIFWITGVIIVGWCIGLDLIALLACNPIQKFWNPAVPGHCTNRQKYYVWATIPNILTDLVLLVLPMAMVWRLQVRTSRKIGLVGVFAAGYCVLVLSVLRLVVVVQLGDTLDKDPTWHGTTSVILPICEVSIALISSCLPSIFNLAKHATGRQFSSLFSRFTGSNPSGGAAEANPGDSNERVFDNEGGADHYTTAYPLVHDHNHRIEDLEMGTPLHQILVRKDIHIAHSSHKPTDGMS